MAGEYWVFEDLLSAAHPHRYEQRWHLAPDCLGRVQVDRAAGVVRAPGIALLFSSGVSLALEAGWYAPRYGIKLDAPVVSAALAGAGDATFITVAVPLAADAPVPRLRVVECGVGGRSSIEVGGVGAHGEALDVVAWSSDGSAATHHRHTPETTP